MEVLFCSPTSLSWTHSISSKALHIVHSFSNFPGIIIAEEARWKDCIEGSTAVVNLAGLPISTRWSPEVVDLINSSPQEIRPTGVVSATAVGYYGTSETRVFDESSPLGNDYLDEVCREWDGTALEVKKDVRFALIRIGVVLRKDGGALGITGALLSRPCIQASRSR